MIKTTNNGKTQTTKDKEAQIGELWALLLKNPLELSEEEINRLLEAKEELKTRLQSICTGLTSNLEGVLRYRERKEQLSQLPTEELKKRDQNIREERAAILRSREEDDIGDSFFGAPPIDSDERIIHELLKERGV